MGEFGPTLIADVPCPLEEGVVKVIGRGEHLLTPHLDVEVTVDGLTETEHWHNKDTVQIGSYLYLVHFSHSEKFTPGLEVGNLVTLGTENDPEFRKAEAAAAAAEDRSAEVGGIIPLA